LVKLEICGVRGVLKSWFKFHFVNHIQFVEMTNIVSNNTLQRYSSLYRETMYGVTQESILGQIWFLLYVNDIPGYVQCARLVLYTDEAWIFGNELVLNTAKTCAMLFYFS